MKCPNCGSENIIMVDHQPLALGMHLKEYGQWDDVLYGTFSCSDCPHIFEDTLSVVDKPYDTIDFVNWLCEWLQVNKHRKVYDGAKPLGAGDLIPNDKLIEMYLNSGIYKNQLG